MSSVTKLWIDGTLLVFDGSVLEVFGFPGKLSTRFHVDSIRIFVQEPNRKDKRLVTIRSGLKSAGGLGFDVDPQTWPEFDALMKALRDAGSEAL